VIAAGGVEGDRLRRAVVEDTWNTAIVPELAPHPGDLVVGKTRYSAFFDTALDDELKAIGAKYLIFTGATTSVCVESTVRDAMFRDYVCVVLDDCTAHPIAVHAPPTNHEASLLVIELLLGGVAAASDVQTVLRAHTDRPAALSPG
jgi:ureidoacrylate peracid hydrolase